MAITSTKTLAGFPDAKSTGVPAGVILSPSGDVTVTKAGTVINALDVKGTIWVMAPNVTIQNCSITSTEWTGVWVKPGITGTVVKDCEIQNAGTSGDGANGIFGSGTFLRNDIHNVENGINVTGSSLIQDNYIHNMNVPNVRGGGPHYDGIEINGGVSGVDILHNTIINENGQTAAVMINNDFGPISDIVVDGNYLAGGGYTLYSDGSFSSTDKISGVQFTDNELGEGYWGYYYFKGNTPVTSGNDELGKSWPTPVSSGGGAAAAARATSGDDVLAGTTGSDTIDGLAGNDTIDGVGSNDTLKGNTGNDRLTGGAGADKLDGGAGTDTASYAGSNAAVNVNLQTGTATGGHAAGDTLTSIEHLMGSSHADTLTGNAGNNYLNGGAGADKLNGGAGTDTASYAGSNAAVNANLQTGTATGGHAAGDTFTGIENLTGSSYADTLTGNTGNNVLNGGAGADKLNGGAGTDTASYSGSNAAVNVNLQTGTATGGHAAGDTFTSIENLTGSSYADTLTGNTGNNVLIGGAGADKLNGGTGTDTASYSGSNAAVNVNLQTGTATGGHAAGDTFTSIENLTGSSYADTLTGNTGNNVLIGGAGADKLNGGTGTDTASYSGSNAAVNVNLQTGTATGGHAAGDTFTSIENLTGSSYADTLKGSAGNNILNGGAGQDTLEGQAGSDVLTGGADADKFVYRESTVKTVGADHITDFSSADFIVFDVSSGPTGALNASAFRAGTAALDGTDRFIFDSAKDALYYDSDGNGAAAKVLVATFDNGYTLSASDFLLI